MLIVFVMFDLVITEKNDIKGGFKIGCLFNLDGESYAMRKCVLSVLGEIVAQVLTKEELTEADRDDRDTFLECLLDHIHDVHAHVRSHVLHIWRGLCKKECIPLSRQHVLLELTTGRLQVSFTCFFVTSKNRLRLKVSFACL